MISSREPTGDSPAEVEGRAVAAERLTFFSDAVIAIALTLLALELPVPEGDTNADLWHSAVEHRGEYIAFLVSFLVIAAHWGGHHRVFRYVTSLGGHVGTLSMYWLLTQVITPFATKVFTGDGAFEGRFVFYAGVQAIANLVFLAILWQIDKHDLYRPDTPSYLLARSRWRTITFAATFLISIVVAFFTTYAWICWIVFPLAGTVITRVRDHRDADLAAPAA